MERIADEKVQVPFYSLMEACARPGVETEDVVGDVVLGPHQVPVLAVEGVPELGHGHRQVVLLTVAQQDVLQGTASCLNCHHLTQNK